MAEYRIHPSIGVARLGNSPGEFYLAPGTVGGLPVDCDAHGNPREEDGGPKFVERFKDDVGRIKRQAAKFRVYKHGDEGPQEVSLDTAEIEKIVWTVHIANKKPVWFTFSELQGDLEFGPENSYADQHVPLNNPAVTDARQRKALMIDPGPRSIHGPRRKVEISRYNVPSDYVNGSFPPAGIGGQQIDLLGELRTDDAGHLVALGGLGNVSGSGDITSFRGASGFWDDISDGYVLATVHLKSGEKIDAEPAWLLVGSPKYAPELVNITTLWDTMYDVAIRFGRIAPEIFPGDRGTGEYFSGLNEEAFSRTDGYTPLAGYNPDYVVDFETQVLPIIQRMQSYRWVADIPYLNDFAHPGFPIDVPDDRFREQRIRYFKLFRVPVLPQDYDEWIDRVENGPNQLFSHEGIPLMPLNSGDNSVTNQGPIYKFEALSVTQYFFLHQWALGRFRPGRNRDTPRNPAVQADEAGVGNCVGAPFSPGIETTWICRNALIYSSLARFKTAHFDGSNAALEAYYAEHGLSTTADEADGQGCEPGDITKRMAIPWQADFQECTVQTPNITNPKVNQFADGTGIEVPPTYYVYWWPPQSPMHVVTGSLGKDDQVLDAVVSKIAGQPIIPAGQRVPYQRGIKTTQDMIDSWSRLGFIVNQGPEDYPYFVETERNNNALVQILLQQDPSKGS